MRNLQCTYTYALTHTCTQTQSKHTQAETHTVLFVSTDVTLPLLSYLRCGGPPSAGPSPAWWPTCGRPRGHAPSLPRPVGPSLGARWKTPHYQCGSDLPGKRGSQISAPLFLQKDSNSTGASNYSVPDQFGGFREGLDMGNDAGRHNLGPIQAAHQDLLSVTVISPWTRWWPAMSEFSRTFPSALWVFLWIQRKLLCWILLQALISITDVQQIQSLHWSFTIYFLMHFLSFKLTAVLYFN